MVQFSCLKSTSYFPQRQIRVHLVHKHNLVREPPRGTKVHTAIFYLFLFFIKIFFNIYLFLRDRERQSMSRGGAEREGDTESEAGSRLLAVSTEPDAGLELMKRKIMTCVEVRHSTD